MRISEYLCTNVKKVFIYMSTLSVLQGLASHVLPPRLLEYFDLVMVEEREVPLSERKGLESGELVFHLEEHDELRGRKEVHTYRPNGFHEASTVNDFPLRDRRVRLVIRRRRWVDERTGKSVGNRYRIVTEGMRHTLEFADFLKETFGYVPDSGFFA